MIHELHELFATTRSSIIIWARNANRIVIYITREIENVI